jgi:hypothetical protein
MDKDTYRIARRSMVAIDPISGEEGKYSLLGLEVGDTIIVQRARRNEPIV